METYCEAASADFGPMPNAPHLLLHRATGWFFRLLPPQTVEELNARSATWRTVFGGDDNIVRQYTSVGEPKRDVESWDWTPGARILDAPQRGPGNHELEDRAGRVYEETGWHYTVEKLLDWANVPAVKRYYLAASNEELAEAERDGR